MASRPPLVIDSGQMRQFDATDQFIINGQLFPNADGNVGECLQTDGNGNLSWEIVTGDISSCLLADGSRELTGNMSVTNTKTVDGRDLSVDGSKLDTIEANADVTDAGNVAAAGAAMAGGAFHDGFSDYAANEHVVLPNTIANVLTDHNLAAHTTLGLQEVISTNQTYYLATTGSDANGDGSSGNPWLTIDKVWSYLNARRVNADVIITVQLADGTYSYAASTLTHNDYLATIIQGTNTYTKTMASVQSSSGGSGAWSIIINLDTVTNIAVNDYVIILVASGGSNPNLMVGCHKVTNVDTGNNRITVTSLSLSASVPSGNVTCTVTVLKTILSYTATNGLTFSGPQNVRVQNLCTVNSNNLKSCLSSVGGAILTLTSVGVYIGICNVNIGSNISVTNSAFSGAYYALNSIYGGIINVNSGCAITGCPGAGIIAQGSGYFEIFTSYISGNTIGVQTYGGGYLRSGSNFYTSNSTQTTPAINTQGTTMNFISSSGDTFA